MSQYQHELLRSSGWEPKDFSSRFDYYSCPFVIAGIENVSTLFDQDLKKSDLDEHINAGDEAAEEALGEKRHGKWYVHDDYGYQKLYNKITRAKAPFFIVTHTESSHKNFPIPRGHKPNKTLTYNERFYYSTKYADSALRRFFEKIKQHPVYKDTIFVPVSDHTSILKSLPLFDRYHIPMLIHAPDIIASGVNTESAFQIDVGPTVLEMLGLGGTYASLGKNIYKNVDKSKRGMILPDWDGYFTFVYDPYILRVDQDRVYEMYNFRENKDRDLGQIETFEEIKKQLYREFLITFQLFGDLIYSNQLIPHSKLNEN